jgi:hypothetical protein
MPLTTTMPLIIHFERKLNRIQVLQRKQQQNLRHLLQKKNNCTNDHEKSQNYNPNTFKSYFTPSYYSKHPEATQRCVRCNGIFGESIKITTKSPAMCCNKQLHKTNPCSHAYCSPCYAMWQGYGINEENVKELPDNDNEDRK